MHKCRFNRMINILALTVLVLLKFSGTSTVQASLSQEYFAASDPGSDADCTYSKPCSLQTAVDMASDGDIIYADWGTFKGGGTAPVLRISKDITIIGGWTLMMSDSMEPIMVDAPAVLEGEEVRQVLLIEENASPTLKNMVFMNGYVDEGEGGGVAIVNSTGGHVIFDHCWILNNYAGWYGGGIKIKGGSLTITNSSIGFNTTVYGGGGISADIDTSVVLENSYVFANNASYGSVGHFDRASLTTKSNHFFDNTGNPTVSINGEPNLNFIFENNMIADNNGAAVTVGSSNGINISFVHNTLVNNLGMGLNLPNNTTGTIVNNIFAKTKYDSIYLGSGSAAVVSHNLFWENGSNSNPGSNPVEQNPLLFASMNSTYHLTAGSPAINTGTSASVNVDFEGDHRPLGLPDIGADEFMFPLYVPLITR